MLFIQTEKDENLTLNDLRVPNILGLELNHKYFFKLAIN